MRLYYHYNGLLLEVYDSNKELLFEIPAVIGDNILLLIEDYIETNKLKITFNELLAL